MSGYYVFQAYNGEAAEEMCARLPGIGLLVLNTEGTGVDTPALVRSVRKLTPGMPVLHIGRSPIPGMPSDVRHLTESFTADQLLETVRALVPRHRVPRPQTSIILVVEDQDVVRAMIVRGLREEGYRVLEATDGEQALAILDGGEHIDLVVTDIILPKLDGLHLANHLTVAGHPALLLFISGYDQDPSTVPGPLLLKPFGPDALVARVRARLGEAQVK
jgi:DNA-binding response OmpR family regulator